MAIRILVTIDTEALPARAPHSHVDRLIWGRFPEGQAGIQEMVAISEDVGVPFLFFLEMAGAVSDPVGFREVATYLRRAKQNVELHFHPEILGKSFWRDKAINLDGLRQDLFSSEQGLGTLSFAGRLFESICGNAPRAYRAGSFRWNRATLEAMEKLGIPFSFNSCRETSAKENYATYACPTGEVFVWSNRVVEVPCGEVEVADQLVNLRYPRRLPNRMSFIDVLRHAQERGSDGTILTILLHSWSFLERDPHTGHYLYKNSKKLERFWKLLQKVKDEFRLVSFDELAEELDVSKLPSRALSVVPQMASDARGTAT